jgi:hypothetical protein
LGKIPAGSNEISWELLVHDNFCRQEFRVRAFYGFEKPFDLLAI